MIADYHGVVEDIGIDGDKSMSMATVMTVGFSARN